MDTFEVIIGLSIMAMALFVFGVELYILKTGKTAAGEICLIDDGGGYRNAHTIWVRFTADGTEKKSHTLHHFTLIPFFEGFQLSRLRKRYVGRSVHFYYNPDRKGQVLIREYIWRDFLLWTPMLALGIAVFLDGICK